jgi:hypothetical protein
MDPDACLEEIRKLLKTWHEMSDADEPFGDHLDMLCERVEALDDWLSKGGFMPTAWVAVERLEGVK